ENYRADGADIIHDIEDISRLPGKIFIFGGSGVYKQTMELVDEMYITRIQETFAGDTFFPEYDMDDWEIAGRQEGTVDDRKRYQQGCVLDEDLEMAVHHSSRSQYHRRRRSGISPQRQLHGSRGSGLIFRCNFGYVHKDY